MRRFLLAVFLGTAISGCQGSSNTTPSTTTATPTASPTASPVPTATPVPPKSENYFPITNQAHYDGVTTPGSSINEGGPLAKMPSLGTTCSASLGTFGDFAVQSPNSIVPAADFIVNSRYLFVVISKNAAGDVYVVGYTSTFGGGTETCVAPYPIAKAQMVKGTGWTYVDTAGIARTAVVVSDHQTATFTAQNGAGPVATTTYTGVVAQVAYGFDQTIYWAAGYGPVQTINAVSATNYPQQFTAHDWVLDPSSK